MTSYDIEKSKNAANDFGLFFYYDGFKSETDINQKSIEATKQITAMGIMRFTLINGILKICLKRPGLLIGHRGKTINALHDFFKKRTKNNECNYDVKRICIEEHRDEILDQIFNFQYVAAPEC
jgi:hypothetical protein